MLRALVLANLEVAVLHLVDRVARVLAEIAESARRLALVARGVQDPLHDEACQCTQLDGELSNISELMPKQSDHALTSRVCSRSLPDDKRWASGNTLTARSVHLSWAQGMG